MSDIDVLLQENRKFEPPDEFRRQAHVSSTELYAEAERDPERFWAEMAGVARVVAPVGHGARLDAAAREVVRRRQAQRLGQLRRPPHPRRRDATRPRSSGRASRATGARSRTGTSTSRSTSSRTSSSGSALGAGDRVGDLPAAHPRSRRSRCSPARASARSTPWCSAASRPSRCATASTTRRRRSSSPPTAAIAAARSFRSSGTPTRRSRSAPSVEHVVVVKRRPGAGGDEAFAADDRRDATTGGTASWPTRRRSASPSRWTPRTCSSSSTRRARRESRRASCTRPAATSPASTTTTKLVFDLKDDDVFWCTADVGWVTGHSYLVYGPLANGATCVMYEGAPDWPEKDRFWDICERLRRDDPLHRADRDPRVHEVGRPVSGEARPLAPAPVRQRRRADQPRSVDVVPRAHRRQPLPDRRHVVADGDRRDRDLAAARRHGDEARQRDDAAARLLAPRCSTRRRTRFTVGGGLLALTQAVAVDAAHDLGRRRALRADVLLEVARAARISTSPATAPSATTTATSGSSAASTTCSTSPAIASARWKSSRRSSSIRRSPKRRSSARRTSSRARRSRRSSRCAKASSSPARAARRAARVRRREDRRDRAARRHPLLRRSAEDALGQDHAPPAARHRREPRARRHDDAGRPERRGEPHRRMASSDRRRSGRERRGVARHRPYGHWLLAIPRRALLLSEASTGRRT